MPHGPAIDAPAQRSAAGANRGRLVAVLLLSLAILLVEAIGGIAANSLALVADAGHMLTDVAGVGMALLAIWFAGRSPSNERTYGYLRLEILAAVANAVLLFGVAVFVLIEAWRRLAEPAEIASGLMLVVALVGLAANAASLFLLRDAQRESLTMRGAYLEVMGDLAGSGAVIVAAVVIGTHRLDARRCRRVRADRPAHPAAHVRAPAGCHRHSPGGDPERRRHGRRPRSTSLTHPASSTATTSTPGRSPRG